MHINPLTGSVWPVPTFARPPLPRLPCATSSPRCSATCGAARQSPDVLVVRFTGAFLAGLSLVLGSQQLLLRHQSLYARQAPEPTSTRLLHDCPSATVSAGRAAGMTVTDWRRPCSLRASYRQHSAPARPCAAAACRCTRQLHRGSCRLVCCGHGVTPEGQTWARRWWV